MGSTDSRGTPRNAILVSAVCYSVFALLPFSSLVVADVLLYSTALLMELAALVALRRREPELRGAFRLPVGVRSIALLAAMPALVLIGVCVLAFRDGEIAQTALLGSALAMGAGPIVYLFVRRRAT
jgi:amino acid transporter